MQVSRSSFSSAKYACTSIWLPTRVAGVSTETVAGAVAVPPASGTQKPFWCGELPPTLYQMLSGSRLKQTFSPLKTSPLPAMS